MIREQKEDSELDGIIRNVLSANDNLIIPPLLSEKTIRKLGKKILLRELVVELYLKVGLVLGSLAMLAGVFLWINGSGVLTNLYNHFINNWRIITSLLFLVFITIHIDQVGLRFYNTYNKGVRVQL